jgi:site-specific DNA recombinase
VSSDQPVAAGTLDSQLTDRRARLVADGSRGARLGRPGLERRRDVAAAGGLDRLDVHNPDRLARNDADQVLLVDALNQQGVALLFLNRAVGETAEDPLLLHVQGMVAEYERAKLLERSRRRKRHAAPASHVGIWWHAPDGDRQVSQPEGGGEARAELVDERAPLVLPVFRWVGEARGTINEVCRRLHPAGIRTLSGNEHGTPQTIWDLLKNPADQGEAAFGKTH